jgi:hypothetical protein
MWFLFRGVASTLGVPKSCVYEQSRRGLIPTMEAGEAPEAPLAQPPGLVGSRVMARRSCGSGPLIVRADAGGKKTWYGLWRVRGRRVKRALGRKSSPGSPTGWTRAQVRGGTSAADASGRPRARCMAGGLTTSSERPLAPAARHNGYGFWMKLARLEPAISAPIRALFQLRHGPAHRRRRVTAACRGVRSAAEQARPRSPPPRRRSLARGAWRSRAGQRRSTPTRRGRA